eukprot:2533950-Amphidinium_carterae.2
MAQRRSAGSHNITQLPADPLRNGPMVPTMVESQVHIAVLHNEVGTRQTIIRFDLHPYPYPLPHATNHEAIRFAAAPCTRSAAQRNSPNLVFNRPLEMFVAQFCSLP